MRFNLRQHAENISSGFAWFPRSGAHRYTQVPAGVWKLVQLVEVRLCLTVRQSLTSIVGAFPIPAGITSFGCPHILVYKDERSCVGTIGWWLFFAGCLNQRRTTFILC